jgi:tetratricopeptide (TPR) repeat protein
VDRIRVTARGREEVLISGIDTLTRRLRSRLGESMRSIEKATVPVSKVTTSSWEALDYFSLAQARRQDGKTKEAVALYELALAKDPEFVAARTSLALVLIQFMGQAEKGKDMLKQALKDAQSQGLPPRDMLPLKAVHRQFVDGDLEGALAEYRTIMELFPDLMPPYNNAGRILQALGRHDEAATMYEDAAKRGPRNSIPLQNLWFLHMNFRMDAPAAESTGRRLVDLAPTLANSHSFLGYCLAVQEKFADAEKELRKALEIEPDHPYALANLGHVLFAAGKASAAVPIYRRVVELDKQRKSENTLVWDSIALALVQREAGQTAEARNTCGDVRAELVKKTSGPAPAPGDWIALGALETIAGERAKAEACLKKIRPAEIKDPYTLCDLAECYAILGMPALAVEFLKKFLQAGSRDLYFPVILPEFQSIRKNPQFRALFKLVG